MTASGYALGKITTYMIKMQMTFLKELIYGNLILNFIFVSGFVIFGVLTNLSNIYFTGFTIFLIILSLVTSLIVLKKVLRIKTIELKKYFLKSSWVNMLNDSHSILVLLGVFMFVLLIAYHAVIINFHSIFGGEFDSIYLFLPISKSILLGNGLNHDYYLGSDTDIKLAPFSQSINSWLLHSFSYSSLKIFPIYFLFFGSLLVYYIAKSITRNKILGLVSATIYLLTPSLLISSSTYSLSQDFTFMFFLAAVFYLLVEVVRYASVDRINLLLLSISIAILPLIKDFGLLISIFILFILPSIKFTKESSKLRAIFVCLAFAPFYGIIIYDILFNGFTYPTILRLLLVIGANVVTTYLTSQIKNQNYFRTLLGGNITYYILPLVIPLVFLISNILLIGGPYPNFIIDNQSNIPNIQFEDIVGQPDQIHIGPMQVSQYIPQIYILFFVAQISIIFFIFQIRGIIIIIQKIKNNPQYSLLAILIILVLLVWSYLLVPDMKDPSSKYLLYLLPLFSVITVIGMNLNTQKPSYQLYYYCIIVVSTFFFINYVMSVSSYDNSFSGDAIFAGFEINQFEKLDLAELLISFYIVLPLVLYKIKYRKHAEGQQTIFAGMSPLIHYFDTCYRNIYSI